MSRRRWFDAAGWVAVITMAAACAVLGGGTLVWWLERDARGSNLSHWQDAQWWAVTTLTTVGYGEHYPVTLLGRVVAVLIMVAGIAVIGAVAAIIAYGFAGQLAERVETAVSHVEAEIHQAEADAAEHAAEDGARSVRAPAARASLQEMTVRVPSADCAASLTWLLARIGWHPDPTRDGVGWRQSGLRLVLEPPQRRGASVLPTVPGRLTFGAGDPTRRDRIAKEALRHGFTRADGLGEDTYHTADDPVVLLTRGGFAVTLLSS